MFLNEKILIKWYFSLGMTMIQLSTPNSVILRMSSRSTRNKINLSKITIKMSHNIFMVNAMS